MLAKMLFLKKMGSGIEEEEESEVQLPKPTSVTPSESEQSEPTRLKTIAQLYEETSPISPP